MKTSYYIGEMARYFGVSADTLRLYEKKGIIAPQRIDNGYRVYSREDMIFLDYVMRLRRLGLPLKSIKKLVDEGSIKDAEHAFEMQGKKLLKRIEELKDLYAATTDYKNALGETRSELGEIRIGVSPRMILRPIGDSLISAVSALEKLGKGVVPRFCLLTAPEDFLAEEGRFNVYDYETRNKALKNTVVLIDRDNAVRVPDSKREEFIIVPPQKCITMAARCHSREDYEAFVRLREYVLERGYTVVWDMICVCIAVRCGLEGGDDFYQVYLPIK